MSYDPPQPKPTGVRRARRAESIRDEAAELARRRPNRGTLRNGEAECYEGIWPTSYTKGLPHDRYGIPEDEAFRLFFAAINARPCSKAAEFRVPLGPLEAEGAYRPPRYEDTSDVKTFCLRRDGDQAPDVRTWESPRAGHVYDLEGPDADGVSMPPAPCLGGPELTAEMAEVYGLALLRDVPFTRWTAGEGAEPCDKKSVTGQEVVDELNKLIWFQKNEDLGLKPPERRRRDARFAPGETELSLKSVFRGSGPGAMDGPYISQFLLIGSPARPNPSPGGAQAPVQKNAFLQSATSPRQYGEAGADPDACAGPRSGLISYGTLAIDQRTVTHKKCLDYMTSWQAWLDVQNGADLRGSDRYETKANSNEVLTRFLTTPRDLATYVHFDALYEAYLNATLLLASYGIPAAAGFPSGPTHSTRDSFATFGVPHVLSLVTEVATRGLKAVRRQKFNYHLRARPEAIGGVLTLAGGGDGSRLGNAQSAAEKALQELATTAFPEWIKGHNQEQNQIDGERIFQVSDAPGCAGNPRRFDASNVLLPMAFPEGSPMHAAYGAGHATVAGACVTIVKAFFELYKDPRPEGARDPLGPGFQKVDYRKDEWWQPFDFTRLDTETNCFDQLWVPSEDGSELEAEGGPGSGVTLVGELNKLAANISIGRNMAGVHYYTDYYDSLRLGERIAAGILQEQMLTYPEAVSMRFESFDGDRIVFETTCRSNGRVRLKTYVRLAGDPKGKFRTANFDRWWCRPSDGLPNARGDANPRKPCFGRDYC